MPVSLCETNSERRKRLTTWWTQQAIAKTKTVKRNLKAFDYCIIFYRAT